MIFGGIVVIFDGVKSGKMLDFSGFYRSVYRSDFGVFLVFQIFKVDVWMEQIHWFSLPNTCFEM